MKSFISVSKSSSDGTTTPFQLPGLPNLFMIHNVLTFFAPVKPPPVVLYAIRLERPTNDDENRPFSDIEFSGLGFYLQLKH